MAKPTAEEKRELDPSFLYKDDDYSSLISSSNNQAWYESGASWVSDWLSWIIGKVRIMFGMDSADPSGNRIFGLVHGFETAEVELADTGLPSPKPGDEVIIERTGERYVVPLEVDNKVKRNVGAEGFEFRAARGFPNNETFTKAYWSKDGLSAFYVAKDGDVYVKNRQSKTTGSAGFASRAWLNNNPGNLEYGEYAKEKGAIGTDGRFAIFPDEQTGFKAQADLLKTSSRYKGLSIGEAIPKYSPASDGNNVDKYLSDLKKAGWNLDTKIENLNSAQMVKLVRDMARIEGWENNKGGKIYEAVPYYGGFTAEGGDFKADAAGTLTLARPVEGTVSDKLKMRTRTRAHRGMDIATKKGAQIAAPAAGRVEQVGWDPDGAGRYVVINHGGVYTMHAHMPRNGTLVKEGQYVRKGQVIGSVGMTGRTSGPHEHFEVGILAKDKRGRDTIIMVDPQKAMKAENLFDLKTQQDLINDGVKKLGKKAQSVWTRHVKGWLDKPLKGIEKSDKTTSAVVPTNIDSITDKFTAESTKRAFEFEDTHDHDARSGFASNKSGFENPLDKTKVKHDKTLEITVPKDGYS